MTKFNLLLLLLAFCFVSVNAQEADLEADSVKGSTHYKWQIGVSVFATDHTSVRGVGDGFFDLVRNFAFSTNKTDENV